VPDYFTSRAATKKWPLVVFLHGSGERGDDLGCAHTGKGPPKLIAGRPFLPRLDRQPAAPHHSVWKPHSVKAAGGRAEKRIPH